MSTHNTHYATEQGKVIPSSGPTFFVICYKLSDGRIRWLARNGVPVNFLYDLGS